jgi:hypothetical protein
MKGCRRHARQAPKRPFFCCEAVCPCYKPAAAIAVIPGRGLSGVTNVIDFNKLEHDGRPKAASQFSAHAWASRPDQMLSAGVAELVDALDLGSSDESCGGSSPSARTKR